MSNIVHLSQNEINTMEALARQGRLEAGLQQMNLRYDAQTGTLVKLGDFNSHQLSYRDQARFNDLAAYNRQSQGHNFTTNMALTIGGITIGALLLMLIAGALMSMARPTQPQASPQVIFMPPSPAPSPAGDKQCYGLVVTSCD